MLAHPPHRRDVAWSLLCGCGGAERRPLLHQPAPLLEHVAAPISSLDLATDGVRQRHLGNLAWKVCLLGYPVAKARPKAMCCQVAARHLPQQLKKRLLMQRSTELAGEDETIGIAGRAIRTHLFQNVESALRKWHAMLFSSLHALGWHCPNLLGEVDLRPPRAHRLAAPSGGQDQELERAGCDTLLLSQRGHEAR